MSENPLVLYWSSHAYDFTGATPAMLQVNGPADSIAEIALTLIQTGALSLTDIESVRLLGSIGDALRRSEEAS